MRGLLGWNVGVWSYLALMLPYLLRADGATVQQRAREQSGGGAVILVLAIGGAVAAWGGDCAGTGGRAPRPASCSPSARSWALAAVAGRVCNQLCQPLPPWPARPAWSGVPGAEGQPPDFFSDSSHFAVTLATTRRPSDVTVSSRPMRRPVLLHAVVAFVFNTSALALLINILAGMVRP